SLLLVLRGGHRPLLSLRQAIGGGGDTLLRGDHRRVLIRPHLRRHVRGVLHVLHPLLRLHQTLIRAVDRQLLFRQIGGRGGPRRLHRLQLVGGIGGIELRLPQRQVRVSQVVRGGLLRPQFRFLRQRIRQRGLRIRHLLGGVRHGLLGVHHALTGGGQLVLRLGDTISGLRLMLQRRRHLILRRLDSLRRLVLRRLRPRRQPSLKISQRLLRRRQFRLIVGLQLRRLI